MGHVVWTVYAEVAVAVAVAVAVVIVIVGAAVVGSGSRRGRRGGCFGHVVVVAVVVVTGMRPRRRQ